MNDKSKAPDEIDYRAEQDKMEALLDQVRTELMAIPGVVEVGMGLREKDGAFTQEIVWRVHVALKKPLDALGQAERVPAIIHGFATDVMTKPVYEIDLGFNDENDMTNYSRKLGGVSIGREGSNGIGTLGCMVRTSDNKVAILSNYHVLWDSGEATSDGKGVGQPEYSASICCTCNEFAATLVPPAGAGRDSTGGLDCALAVLKTGVTYTPKIRAILRGDGTVENAGTIAGSEAPTVNDIVWKVGRTTGLTRGIITGIVGNKVALSPSAPFTDWSEPGDSGSAIIKQSTGNVVALHWGGPAGGPTGVALPIPAALALLNVSVIPTASGDGTQFGIPDEERLGVAAALRPEDMFAAIADRLRMTPRGDEILGHYRRHAHEISQRVNTTRPVTVAWQRNAGPAWMAAVMRSVREPLYHMPSELNGVHRSQLSARLLAALDQYGSRELCAALAEHGPELRRVWVDYTTVDAMIAELGADKMVAEAAL